ncbi:MAG: hypothetical protein CNIPEHKO_03348 [Anaerolineales bacterium]|nr:hypothetical protein [Anaerolineales bacterium]
MKPSSKRTLGVILIALSVLAAAIGVCQITPLADLGMPCWDADIDRQEINSSTRIVYCINFVPLDAVSGAWVDAGSTDQNEIAVREIHLRRDGQILFINNHMLSTGETYDGIRWTPSVNPWILFTRGFVIKNEGLFTSIESPTITDALYVSGNVYEGWRINPLGFIILGSGIWLFWQGKKELKQEILNTAKAG